MARRDTGWYQSLLGAVPGVVLVVDGGGTVGYADRSVEALFGRDPEALVGEPVFDLIHPGDRDAVRRRLDGAGGTGGDGEDDREEHGDGDSRLPEASEAADGGGNLHVRVRDPDGRWRAATATVADRTDDPLEGYVVTLRAAAESASPVDAPAKYRTLVESVADPMFWLGPDGTVEMVNDATTELLSIDRDRLVGSHVSEFVDEDVVAAFEERIGEQVARGDGERVREEFRIATGDGRTRWVESSVSTVVEDGVFCGTVGVLRDVTDRKRREQDLATFETIVETAPVGLFTLDEDAVVTWANEYYAETLDMPREELVGTQFLDLVEAGYYDDEVVEPYLDTVRDLLSSELDVSQGSYLVETHVPGGGTQLHEVYTALLPMEDGEFRGTVSAFRDVTKQKEYERQLERQNERLDAFSSVVSHDLRNPLAVAEGMVDAALETGNLDHLEEAQRAHERMDALIGDLLSLSREGRAVQDVAPVDLVTTARRAWASVDTGGATLRVDAPGVVLADGDRLQQLLENLFRNAVEHGSTSPRSQGREDAVEHGAGVDPDGDAHDLTVVVGALADGDGFYVADDGVGIPPDERERVFDHGYTTADDGTGFGLAIVETIADAHDWTVSVAESAAGGARFEVRGVERP